MSPDAATHGVTLFFQKTGDFVTFFSHRLLKMITFLAVVSSLLTPSPPSNVLCPVFFVNSATKNKFHRVSPPLDQGRRHKFHSGVQILLRAETFWGCTPTCDILGGYNSCKLKRQESLWHSITQEYACYNISYWSCILGL